MAKSIEGKKKRTAETGNVNYFKRGHCSTEGKKSSLPQTTALSEKHNVKLLSVVEASV